MWAGTGAVFREMGALDGLTAEEVRKMGPAASDGVLVTRMRDGTSVTLADQAVIPRVQQCIRQLEDEVSAIVLLCTGTFPPLDAKVPILIPEHLLTNFVRGVAVSKPLRLGVMTPDAGQFPAQRQRWGQVAAEVVTRAASPYDGPEAVLDEGRRFREDRVDLVVLDCMGYTSEMRTVLRNELPCPVVLARAVVGHFAAELL